MLQGCPWHIFHFRTSWDNTLWGGLPGKGLKTSFESVLHQFWRWEKSTVMEGGAAKGMATIGKERRRQRTCFEHTPLLSVLGCSTGGHSNGCHSHFVRDHTLDKLQRLADVAVTLFQPSWVAAWWKCNLGKQYINCNTYSYPSRNWVLRLVVAEVHALMQGFQPLHHLYSWLISALHTAGGVLISRGRSP